VTAHTTTCPRNTRILMLRSSGHSFIGRRMVSSQHPKGKRVFRMGRQYLVCVHVANTLVAVGWAK
jgi:hypothetical protein